MSLSEDYARAQDMAESGKYSEAMESYRQLLLETFSAVSLRAKIYNGIGALGLASGDAAMAAHFFRQAIFTDTLFMDAYRNLMALNAEEAKGKKKFRLSISIPTYNRCNELKRCIDSLRENSFYPLEIIVVCDPCNDGTVEYLKGEEGKGDIVPIINKEHIGATRSWNIGLEKATGDYVALLNDDHEVMPGWDLAAIAAIDDDETAGCGVPLVVHPDGKIQSAGQYNAYLSLHHEWIGRYSEDGASTVAGMSLEGAPRFQQPRECDYGYVPVMKRECFEKAGPLDERYEHYFTDTDLGYKIQQAGYKNIYCPTAVIVHHLKSAGDIELGTKRFEADKEKFYAKWGLVPRERFHHLLRELVRLGLIKINPSDKIL
jgi:GT2 family glycosyltransferase